VEEGNFELKWVIPANIFNEGIYKLGIILFNKEYDQLFNFPDMLIFKTRDNAQSSTPFHIFTPIKPIIDFIVQKEPPNQ
jgi:hypothetical protein